MAAARKSPAMRFLDETLPMYHEPLVKMRFKSIDRSTQLEAIVSKDRLCSSSRVFDKMLNGKFKEAIEPTIELEELPNVVTRETFVGFIRWLYERDLAFDPSISPQERVSEAIDLARFGDMYLIGSLESATMRYIVENIVVENDALTASKSSSYRRTAWITSSHIISALNLPQEHQIRIILAYASVEGYLRRDHYKFKRLAVEYPKYGSDIVRVAGKMLFGIGGPNALRNAKRWLANLPE